MSANDGEDIDAWMARVKEEARRLFNDAVPFEPSSVLQKPHAWPVESHSKDFDDFIASFPLNLSLKDKNPVQFDSKAIKRQDFGINESNRNQIANQIPATDAHGQLLALEAEFQARLIQFQDDQTLDFSNLVNLKYPIDTILDLLLSLHVTKSSDSTPSSSVNLEATLQIIQTLIAQYDGALAALQRSRDMIGRIESTHVLHQQRTTEWGNVMVKDIHRVRQAVQRSRERETHLETERDILRQKVLALERDRKTSDTLVLEMAKKVNESDEKCFRLEQEAKQVIVKMTQLKAQMNAMKKMRSHFNDLFNDRDFFGNVNRKPLQAGLTRSESTHATRSRSLLASSPHERSASRASSVKNRQRTYSQELKIEQELKQRTKSPSRTTSSSYKASSGYIPSSAPKKLKKKKAVSRSSSSLFSEPRSHSNIAAQTALASSSHRSETFANQPNHQDVEDIKAKMSSLLDNTVRQKTASSPAKNALLLRLREVDEEINQLARELLI